MITVALGLSFSGTVMRLAAEASRRRRRTYVILPAGPAGEILGDLRLHLGGRAHRRPAPASCGSGRNTSRESALTSLERRPSCAAARYSSAVCGRFGWPSGNIARANASWARAPVFCSEACSAPMNCCLALANSAGDIAGVPELRGRSSRAPAADPSCRHLARISRASACRPRRRFARRHCRAARRSRNLSSDLVPRSSIMPVKRGNRDVAGSRHGVARGQRAQDDDHVFHARADR